MPDSSESASVIERLTPMPNSTGNRQGNADDLIRTPEVADMLGVTIHTLHKLADVGRAPEPVARVGSRNVYRRGDIWEHQDIDARKRERTGPCRAHQCRGTGTIGRQGLCPRHRNALDVLTEHDTLQLLLPVMRRSATLADKLRTNSIDDERTGCRIWLGARVSDGYGSIDVGARRKVSAHRAAFEVATGRPIDTALEPDHECNRRACIRIGAGHVVEVTHAENMHRMARRAATFFTAAREVRVAASGDALDVAA